MENEQKQYKTNVIQNTRNSGDTASQLIHEGTRQGWPNYGHPTYLVERDIMATPDIPTLTEKKAGILGDAALAVGSLSLLENGQRKDMKEKPTIIIKDYKLSTEGTVINGAPMRLSPNKLAELRVLSLQFGTEYCAITDGVQVCFERNNTVDELEKELSTKDLAVDRKIHAATMAHQVDLPIGIAGNIEEIISDQELSVRALDWATETYASFLSRVGKQPDDIQKK
jgi:hypothetical protein